MKKIILLVFASLLLCSINVWADDFLSFDDFDDDKGESVKVLDPIESVNRLFFGFNALLYKVILQPASEVCKAILPEEIREGVDNVWTNLKAPIRVVNNVLQGNINGAGREVARFLINSTVGVAGLTDPAKTEFGIEESNEDFGQTLAHWGIGSGIYLVLPVIGPMTLRDGVGLAGDAFLFYQVYCPYADVETLLGSYAGSVVNGASLKNPYKEITENAFMPYIAVRNAYVQYRNCQIVNNSE